MPTDIPRIRWAWLLLALIVIGLLACEMNLARIQQGRVDRHLKTFGITEHRAEVAKRLGARISPNGRWWSIQGLEPPVDYPIGTYPNARLIGFRELEGWPVHRSDRHGFFNDDAWWDDQPTVLIVGDSFVTGETMQSCSITGLLRARGCKALNLGLTSSGPFLELAALRAYYPSVSNSVQWIVWVFYEGNDFEDAASEAPFHRHVLDPAFEFHPNPERLNELPADDWKLFGLGYAVRSVLALKRTRLAFDYWRGSPVEVAFTQECLDYAQRLGPPVLLVRVRKVGWDLARQWRALRAPCKAEMPADPNLYSGGLTTAHYTAAGYQKLADLIQSHVECP